MGGVPWYRRSSMVSEELLGLGGAPCFRRSKWRRSPSTKLYKL